MQALRRVGGGERRNQGAGGGSATLCWAGSQGVGAERVSSVSGHHDWIYLAVPSVSGLLPPPGSDATRYRWPSREHWLARSLAGPMGQWPPVAQWPVASDQ